MGFSERLAELGIELPPVAAPVAAYIPATRFGDVIRTSGQLPLVDGALPAARTCPPRTRKALPA